MLKKLIVFVCIYFIFITPSSADVIVPGPYLLGDHPDGNLSATSPYGLRMDRGLTGYDNSLFSTELNGARAILNWDGAAASIAGTLWNNQSTSLWSVENTFTGVTAIPVAMGGGFNAAGGKITLTNLANPFDTFMFNLKQKVGTNIAYTFDYGKDGGGIGWRCTGQDPNECGPIVGRGWIDVGWKTNDWLTTATLVPIPASLPLFVAGLGMLIMLGRKYA